MTSKGDWKRKLVVASKETTRRRYPSPLLGNNVINVVQEPTNEDLVSTRSPGVSTILIKSIKRKHTSEDQCAWKHKKVSSFININKERCPSSLPDNDATGSDQDPINEDLVSTKSLGVWENWSKSWKRNSALQERCADVALLPEKKVPPKVSTWGSDFFYRPKNEPQDTIHNSVWESDYFFRPKEKCEQKYKETMKSNKKRVYEARHKTSANRIIRQAKTANVNGYNSVQCAESRISRAETMKVPAKRGNFDNLDELPVLFKGEACE